MQNIRVVHAGTKGAVTIVVVQIIHYGQQITSVIGCENVGSSEAFLKGMPRADQPPIVQHRQSDCEVVPIDKPKSLRLRLRV